MAISESTRSSGDAGVELLSVWWDASVFEFSVAVGDEVGDESFDCWSVPVVVGYGFGVF